ncbi:hypothetical protein [Clostridium sp. C8]|uniref:hypothetical protein n=1 Tax=Clostridium sp. C8 TaxID=1667357 RepID=UPI00062E72FA|nr:hypothetical protein [Clostridium sp. C8]KLE14598.1 hypothetical protein AAT22_15820 [Clostridium sp. C8]
MKNKSIYWLTTLIILGGVFGIIDFRFGLNDKFTLLNDIFSIILFAFILIGFIFNNAISYKNLKSIQFWGGVLIFYFIFEFILSIARNGQIFSTIFAIKNLLIPITIFWGATFFVYKINNINALKIIKIINFFAVINIILVILGFILGWGTMTKYILGESLYASSVYSFGHSSTMLRVPGLFVDALTQGAFSYLVFVINFISFIDRAYIKRKNAMIFFSIGILGVVLSTNRQVILGMLVAILILIIIRWKKVAVSILSFSLIIILIGLIMINNSNRAIFSKESLSIRNQVWTSIIEDMDISNNQVNLLIGTGVDATTIGKNEGGIDLVDNTYLLILHDYGLIGLIVFLMFISALLKYLWNSSNESTMAKIGLLYTVFFIVRMFFHSSIVNEYDSYIFYIIELMAIIESLYNKNERVENEVKR